MKKIFVLFTVLILITPSIAYSEIVGRDVKYKDGATELQGYIAYDSSIKGKRPGVLIVHEWTGINDYIKDRARRFASLGYVAFAADIYGRDYRPETLEDAERVSYRFKKNVKLLRRRLNAGLKRLKSFPQVNPGLIVAVGYSFGGMAVLELARTGVPLKGVISVYGSLYPDVKSSSNIRTRVLVLHGGDDPFVGSDKLLRLWRELQSSGVQWEIHIYGGAVHSFTNPESGDDPSVGVAYNPYADRHSWKMIKEFLYEVFR